MDQGIKTIRYQETEHFTLTRDFINRPEQFLNHLVQ